MTKAIQSHMAGQIDAGVDPSFSNAQEYANQCEALKAVQAENAALREKLNCVEWDRDGCMSVLEKVSHQRDGLQAKIDALMLEYCPDEMTPEQIDKRLAQWLAACRRNRRRHRAARDLIDAQEALQAQLTRERKVRRQLVEALGRTLSWLTSYPGEAAIGPSGPYEQARSALAASEELDKEVDDGI